MVQGQRRRDRARPRARRGRSPGSVARATGRATPNAAAAVANLDFVNLDLSSIVPSHSPERRCLTPHRPPASDHGTGSTARGTADETAGVTQRSRGTTQSRWHATVFGSRATSIWPNRPGRPQAFLVSQKIAAISSILASSSSALAASLLPLVPVAPASLVASLTRRVQLRVLLEVRGLEVVGPEHPQVVLDQLGALLLDEDRAGAELGVVVVGHLGDDRLDRLGLDLGLGRVVDAAGQVAVGADVDRCGRTAGRASAVLPSSAAPRARRCAVALSCTPSRYLRVSAGASAGWSCSRDGWGHRRAATTAITSFSGIAPTCQESTPVGRVVALDPPAVAGACGPAA